MATHTLSSKNWTNQLATLIEQAKDGDIIIVRSEAQKELGEKAKGRMCPDKKIEFRVETIDSYVQ